MRKPVLAALLGGLALLQTAAWADVKLPAIFSDNMVLQAGKPVHIWGTADKQEKVTVSVGGQTVSTTAGADGKWQVELKPLAEGDGALEMNLEGNNKLTVKNILVGSVWIASGQSNMEFGMGGAHNAATEIPLANHPKLRLFTVTKKIALEPQSDCVGKWVECTPETVRSFSAVGYFFGRDLQVATGKPVGMIHTSWGGTPAQSWVSLDGLEKDPELKQAYADAVRGRIAKLPELKAKYEQELPVFQEANKKWQAEHKAKFDAAMKAWWEEAQAARAAGKPEPRRPDYKPAAPKAPEPPEGNAGTPAGLYNAMIAPLVPLSVEGAIWYQGESNAGNAQQYRTLFPRMITDWREKFGQDFAFLFVQLANYGNRPATPVDTGWARLREAQTMTLALPKTGMAVIIDIGQGNDIHPRDKMDVGRRLFLAAQRV
ncbi:MAG: sialate O-acetylesterase, partial [Phycisphaerae bacterium]